MKMQERIKQLLTVLNKDVFEKEEITAFALLSAIAGESLFLLGAPGVAKSLIARRLKFAFKDGKSFEYLMNRFSTPDEIFGPVAISKLKNDEYERIVENYLPDATVIFLDEIWKAGPSIQNALLTVLNEKKYRNGKKEIDVDIRGLISASNELPEQGQGLEALWDRFLIRYLVTGIQDRNTFNRMISEDLQSYTDNIPEKLKITDKEYKEWASKITSIKIPEEIFNVIYVIRASIQKRNEQDKEEQIYISDRRWRKIIQLLRTSAFLNQRDEVDLMDCFLIAHCIWDKPEQINEVKDIVAKSIKEYGYALNLNIEPIKTEIEEFDTEVKVECKKKKPRYEVEFKKIDDDYYQIEGLKRNTTYNLIKISDYENLPVKKQQSTALYDSGTKKINISVIDDEEGNIRVYSNQWQNCTIKTHKVEYEDIVTSKPNPRLKDAWDKKIKEIVEKIDKEVKSVEKYRDEHHSGLHTNLFVNPNLANLVEHNLHQTIEELQQHNLEADKIKHFYDDIE